MKLRLIKTLLSIGTFSPTISLLIFGAPDAALLFFLLIGPSLWCALALAGLYEADAAKKGGRDADI